VPTTPQEHFDALVDVLLTRQDVALGSAGKRGFGSSALQAGSKIFAMLANGRLALKLPRQRVDALVAVGAGTRFEPRHDGRLMKEWLVVDLMSLDEWSALADEAKEFVAPEQ